MILDYGRKFDFDRFMKILKDADYEAPVVTLIAQRDDDPFKTLVSTMLSARTKDEMTIKATEKLFLEYDGPSDIAQAPIDKLEQLIYPVGFYKTKAAHLKKLAAMVSENGVPDTREKLMELPGVGRKTANLVLAEAFSKDAICVDTHVHRISNRLGILDTETPRETEEDLTKVLPRKYWKTYNTYLVAHGQTICKPVSPMCSRCPVKKFCHQCGVQRKR